MNIKRLVFKKYLPMIIILTLMISTPYLFFYLLSTVPEYVLIDLGANKGDNICNFFGIKRYNQGGNLKQQILPQSFKSAKWIIYGFEANSFFDEHEID
jgi:hypothetical protein